MRKKYEAVFLSILIWGSGQFLIGKQRVKGFLLFMTQVLMLGIELGTGYWFNYFAGQIKNFELRLYGGFFTKGIWGLLTMGTVEGVRGDHSTILLINGIIALMALLVFVAVYFFNIYDAINLVKSEKLLREGRILKSLKSASKRKAFPYIVLTPSAIIIALIVLMPIIFSVLTSFTNYDTNHLPPAHLVDWVGLTNFIKLISVPIWTKTFLRVLIWTILWALLATFSTYFMGLFQALILNSNYVKYKAFFRTIYILPWAIPGMISLLVFKNLLNGQFGPINQLLMDFGIIKERIPFLTDPIIAKITVICVNLWLGFPTFMVMLLGVLSNQDESLYEAASIDGASKYQVFAHVKLPLLMRATAPLIVMNLAGNFNNFGAIYFLTSGGPTNPKLQFAGDTDILISWIYKLTLDQRLYSMAAVMNILIFIFIAAVSIWNFRRTNAFKEM
ncbi:carbohydrate ABC transporter permease [Clostridium sp. Marseille-P299]|uniref:carbohydrate ABC transporter permease n=1 Tax=Clostridium sp. Marseille-P299 TaxID=1805477 RepID=UPI00082E2F13|nr:sugar ABC transporter permease [Clostridium sp. Marseille-P299]